MARIVKRLRNGPYSKVTKTEEPGRLYWYDSSRQRHPAAEEHAEMCTEQQLESW